MHLRDRADDGTYGLVQTLTSGSGRAYALVVAGLAAAAAALAALWIAVPFGAAAHACTITFDGGPAGTGTAWGTAANWSGDVLPGATSHVCIPDLFTVVHSSGTTTILSLQSLAGTTSGSLTLSGGTLTLTSTDPHEASSVADLTQTGGTLGGDAELVVAGDLVWSSGAQTGAGRTRIVTGATVTLGTTGFKDLTGARTFRNEGTATWTDGSIRMGGSGSTATFQNTATFTAAGDDAITSLGGTPLVHNLGGASVAKTGDTTSTISVPFENDGTVSASAGTLALNGGDGTGDSSGSFGGTGAANIDFNSGVFSLLDATFTGRAEIGGGTVNAEGTVSANASSNLSLVSGGTLGGAGTVSVAGAFIWNGGIQTGAGQTTVGPTGTLTMGTTSLKDLNATRVFRNEGAGTWSDGLFRLGGGGSTATFQNAGTFAMNSDAGVALIGGTPLIHNQAGGTIEKTAGTSTLVGVAFENDGALTATAGTVTLNGGDGAGDSSGSFGGTGAAGIDFNNGTFSLLNASFTGRAEIGGATVNAEGTVSANASSNLSLVSGGTLGGAGTISVAGAFTWGGGTQTGTGQTTISPGATLTMDTASLKDLTGSRVLRNEGTVTWADGGIRLGTTAVFQNAGALALAGDETMSLIGGTPLFHNQAGGTIEKTAGTTTLISVALENDGALTASAGTVTLNGGDGAGDSSGSFGGSGAASIDFNNGTFSLLNASFTGRAEIGSATVDAEGAVTATAASELSLVSGGTLSGGGTVTVSGALVWDGGVQTGTGQTTIAPTGSLTMDTLSLKDLTGSRVLRNDGTATWIEGGIRLGGGGSTATFQNAATFAITGDNVMSLIGGTPLFHNQAGGTIEKTAGAQSLISAPFDNDGTVIVDAGTLDVTGSFANYAANTLTGGTYDVSATFRFTSADVVTNAANVILEGTGAIQTTGSLDAFRNLATNAAAGQITLRGGPTITTPGAFANAGVLQVEGASSLTATGPFTNTGTVRGTGSVSGAMTNQGAVAPGVSPGILTVQGSYTSDPAGTLAVEVGGPVPGTEHDQLQVTGAATLDGTLAITTLPGFTPTEGQAFTILQAGTVTGSFDSVTGADLGGGLRYVVQITPSAVILNVAARTLSIADGSATEGGTATFELTLDPPDPDNSVLIHYATAGGSATTSDDFIPQGGTIAFLPNQTTKTLSVPTVEDTLDEDDETFTFSLDTPIGASIADGIATGTIVDDDPLPEVSLEGTAVAEGDAGTTEAIFTVALSAPSGRTVTVEAAAQDDTATLADDDYEDASRTVTFLPGDTVEEFAVLVNGDTVPEPNEQFQVALSTPTNSTISPTNGTADATIQNDDTGSAVDLAIFKSDFDDPVGVGETITYGVSAFNQSNSAAADVEVTDDLPDGTTFVSATPSVGGSCNDADPVQCTWPEIGAFGSVDVEIEVLAPLAPTTLSNTATVASAASDPDLTNNSSTEETEVDVIADLFVTKEAAPEPAIVGEPLTYTVTIENTGPASATGVTLTDLLPNDFTFTSVSPTPACSEDAGTVTCALGTIPVDGQAVVTIVGEPTEGGVLFNNADVTSDQLDPTGATGSAFSTVLWEHDVSVTKTDAPDPIFTGDDVTYTITVENEGADPLTGVTATDTLPAGMAFVSSASGCTAVGQVVTCSFGNLAPGEVKNATFVAEATTGLTKTNTVTVSANEGDDNPANNTATTTTRVRDSALEIARAMIEDEGWLAGASFVTIPPRGNPNMVGSTTLAGFPRHGGTYGLLTTGDAELADDPNTSTGSGLDIGGGNVRGDTDFDVTVLKVDLNVPQAMNCLSLNFRFLSEEYPEWLNSEYNDAFVAEVGASTWTTAGSAITAPNNFAFDPEGSPITINAAGFTSMTADQAIGTTYDGATPLLSASQSVGPGAQSLYLSIFDQGDHILDSAVMLDRLRLSSAAPGACNPGATILSTVKTADAPTSISGATNGYTISVSNPHTEPFSISALTDDLPAGFTYVPGSTTGITTANPTISGQRLTWTGPFTLPAGGSVSLSFDVTVATAPGVYLNNAAAEGADVAITPTGPTAPITVLPTISIDDVTVTEGNSGTTDATFTVSLNGAGQTPVTVDFLTEDVTATAAFTDAQTSSSFVTRSGDELFLDGVPYRFAGLNAYNLNSDGLCWYAYDSAQLDASLAAIGSGGKSVLRAWFFQNMATTGGVRDWTDIDETLDRARAAGFKVIATLGNQWADCDQGYGEKDRAWYDSEYDTVVDPEGTKTYRDWVAEIVDRYENDPAILAWEPINEAETSNLDDTCLPDAAAVLHAFMTDVTGLIKSIDSNHLVSSGLLGSGQCGASFTEYAALHSIPSIDLCSVHDYSIGSPSVPMPGDVSNGLQFRLNQCAALDKPVVIGEAGIRPVDEGGAFADRDAAFHAKLLRQIPAGVAGYLGWAWSREGSTLETFDIGPGDGVLGLLAGFGDYESAAGTVTFAPGETSKTVTIRVVGDLLDELDETYLVQLAAPTGATIADGTGVGTITDDDGAPAVSIADAATTEGNAGTKTLTFDVTLAAPSGKTVTVPWSTENGSAVEPGDYAAAAGTVTFEPGQVSKTVSVTLTGDTVFEADETFSVELGTPTDATVDDGTATGTIHNDDAAPTLSIDDVTLTEGNSGTKAFTFTVTKTGATQLPASVQFTTSDGTATQPGDYASASGTLNFAAGDDSETVTVQVTGETAVEPDETFFVTLSNPSGATIADPQGVGTIQNDDAPGGTLSISDESVTEGNEGLTTATFDVTLSEASASEVTVTYTTSNGTAVAPGDYATTSGTLTFVPGDTTETITVNVVGETVFENDETFTVTLSSPAGAGIADGTGTGTIQNDDAAPTISIGDVTQAEGDTGITTFTFTVSKTGATELETGVQVTTANGTAVAPGDYATTGSSVTFAPGETARTFSVTVFGDTVFEADETFTAILSAPSNGTIGDGAGTATIQNDDLAPTLTIDDVSLTEGDAGTKAFTFTVTRTGATELPSSVDWQTVNGSTDSGVDYTPASGTLTFPAGTTSQTISVNVLGDLVHESDEVFFVTLSNASQATVSDTSGLATILNDDAAPTLSIGDVTQAEGNAGTTAFTLTVTKTGSTQLPASVQFATSDGTAEAGSDYTAISGTLTFTAGDASETITVNVSGDTVLEPNETFTVTLSSPSGASIGDGSGTGTIQNDDGNAIPSVEAGDAATVDEGSLFTRGGSFTDADLQSWTATVDYGDGAGAQPLALTPGKTFTLSHTYADDGVYTVTVSVSDGLANGVDTFQVTVDNVDPAVDVGLDATLFQGATFERTGSFTDPGTGDTHTATVDYGDGSGVQPLDLSPDGTFDLVHTYVIAGTHTVTVTVTDDDGGVGVDSLTVTVSACEPVVHTLSNGDPATTDGAVSLEVDALGAFGEGLSLQSAYNPVGTFPNAPDAQRGVFSSNLYVSTLDRFLTDTCADGPATLLASTPNSVETEKTLDDLGFHVTQTLSPTGPDGSTTLTQEIEITNDGAAGTTLALARLLDGDLAFQNQFFDDGLDATANGSRVRVLDTANRLLANPFVAAGGNLDGDATPDRFTGQPFDYRTVVEAFDGIPALDSGTIANDVDGDLRADSELDAGATQQWSTTIAPGGTVTLTVVTTFGVQPPNSPPAAGDDAATTAEDTAADIDVLANDDDPENDPFVITSFTQPANGTVTENANGTLHYVPNADFNGTDTFTYTVDDGLGGPDTATVTVTVTAVNDAPSATDDAITVDEDASTTFDARTNDSKGPANESGQALTVTLVSNPPNGTATITAGGLVQYTPDADYFGTDSFTYTVCDDGTTNGAPDAKCDTATVSVTVAPVNDPPAAANDTLTVAEDATATALDPRTNDSPGPANESGQALTITGVTDPANGTATFTATGVQYTPDADYFGADSFEYTVCDNGSPSLCDTATVSVTVTPVNDTPVAGDDTLTVAEDAAATAVDVLANDSEGPANEGAQTLSVTAVSDPANGTATFTAGGVQYTPDANYFGTDSFTYTVCDSGTPSLCDTATVSVTVTPVNDPPVAANDAYTTPQGTAVTVDVRTNDTVGPANESGQTLGAPTVTTGPANGTAGVNGNGTVTYTPNAGFAGTDTFVYEVCDSGTPSLCDTATVTVNVQPQISISNVTVTEGSAGLTAALFVVTLSGPSTSTVSGSFATANGTALAGPDYQGSTGMFTFVPGATSLPLVVNVVGDTLDENDEGFVVNLTGPVNATFADAQGAGTIVDDDAPPALGVGDVTVIEGNSGTLSAELKIALNVPSGKPVSVSYATSDGTASAPSDYLTASGTASFAPGETLRSVFVTVNGDTAFEPNETFTLNLSSPVNATIGDGQATGTIRNDDSADGCTITGTSGPDDLDGTPGNDIICALGGNDTVDGLGGNDIIRGGAGNDTLRAGAGNDTVVGEAGADRIDGGGGVDAIDGGDGADVIAGGDGADTLKGGDGGDEFDGNAGNDTIEGAAGNDEARGGAGDDTMTGGAGNDNFVGNGDDDKLDGGAGSDRVLGDAGNDVVDGGPDDDGGDLAITTDGGIRGGPGNDILRGEGGDDLLGGGPGNDTINAGPGVDFTIFIASPAAVTVNLTTGTATGEGTDSLSGVEETSGTPFGDTLIGSSAANYLTGGGGKDKLYGRAGNDLLSGGDGNDLLRGEAGYDTLQGAAGTDDCGLGAGGGVKYGCEIETSAFLLSNEPKAFVAKPPRLTGRTGPGRWAGSELELRYTARPSRSRASRGATG